MQAACSGHLHMKGSGVRMMEFLVLLLQVYEKLNAEGRFQEKLLEMYRWGKANGWDAAPPVNTAKQGV